jgi:hypothetical protein
VHKRSSRRQPNRYSLKCFIPIILYIPAILIYKWAFSSFHNFLAILIKTPL